MARAGNDYATADTTTAGSTAAVRGAGLTTAGATTTQQQPEKTEPAGDATPDGPTSSSGKSTGTTTGTAAEGTAAKGTAAKRAGTRTTSKPKTTSKLKTAGRKTAAKIKGTGSGAATGKARTTARSTRNADSEDTDTAPAAPAIDDSDPLNATVQAAQQGDSEAFRILYREVQPKLLRYLSFLVDTDDAEDIASETWLQATRDFHKFQGNMDNFRGWMSTIARHRAMDHLRKHSRQPPAVPMPVEEFSYVAAADDTEARAIESITTGDAVKLISTLPKDQAEAVMLRAVVGLDAKTAAQVAGKRAGAIRTAAYRGLKTLAKRLGVAEDA